MPCGRAGPTLAASGARLRCATSLDVSACGIARSRRTVAGLEAVGWAPARARRCKEHDAYCERPGAAECVDGIARNRGLQHFVLRGFPSASES